MRRATNGLFNGAAWLAQARYTYDAASRLQTVGDGTNYARYGYLSNSPLVSQVWFTNNGTLRMTASKYFDYLNRLTAISNINSQASNVSSFAYGYNAANQRTGFTNADNSRWAFGYDGLGQVTSGKKYWSDGGWVAGEQFTYTFDDIGNRTATSSGGDQFGGNLRPAAYYANALNQLTNRTVPGYVNILGTAYPSATVSVLGPNGLYASTYRRGDFFRAEPAADNTGGALWLTLTNFGLLLGGTSSDVVTNITGSVYLPKTPEQFYYDPDGNLTNDGRWTLTWDGENRLVSMSSLSGAPTASKLKLDFQYDYQGRRVQKTISIWNGSAYVAQGTNRFAYDGWNLIAVLSPQSAITRSFIWGVDLSGTIQGAGGVGGLLLVNDATNGAHFAAFDGNGNVSALIKAADGTVSANYEYSPFGELLRATGPMARSNPFRFSTKYQDSETDLLYYFYRFYNPSTGRWLSRDPFEENGELNLYGFVLNQPISFADSDGRSLINWARGEWDNAVFFKDWLFNTGSTNRHYIDGDRLTEYLKISNGMRRALEEYKRNGCKETLPIGYETMQGYRDQLLRLGVFNPAEFQIGGFVGTITKLDKDRIHVHIDNNASLASLLGQPTFARWFNAAARQLENGANSGIRNVNSGAAWTRQHLPTPIRNIPAIDIPTVHVARWAIWPIHTREDIRFGGNIHQEFDFTMPNPCCQ